MYKNGLTNPEYTKLEYTKPRMYNTLDTQKLECTNLICTNLECTNLICTQNSFLGYLMHATYPGMYSIAACPVETTKSVWLCLVSQPTIPSITPLILQFLTDSACSFRSLQNLMCKHSDLKDPYGNIIFQFLEWLQYGQK